MKNNIVIVGGGFAGLYTALELDNYFNVQGIPDYAITVIRSKNVGTIGVGESVVQGLLTKFTQWGIPHEDFLKASSGTFKLGGSFENWNQENGQFFHPLIGSEALLRTTIELDNWWVNFGAWWALANDIEISEFSLIPALYHHDMLPMDVNGNPIAFEKSWAKHPTSGLGFNFDAVKIVDFLELFITRKKPKINLVDDKIIDFKLNKNTGDIESLILEKDKKHINGTFYFDCSGFSRVLGKFLNIEFEEFDDLPQNSVTLIKNGVQYRDEDNIPLAPKIRAMNEGWMFTIPLQHRMGSGYVFSSKFTPREKVLQEHLTYWKNLGYKDVEPGPQLTWQPGMFKQPLHKNVLMVGLSEGFLDPLDSNSLILSLSGIEQFLRGWNLGSVHDNDSKCYNLWRKKLYIHTKKMISFMMTPSNKSLNSAFWNHYKSNRDLGISDPTGYLKNFTIIDDMPIYAPFGGMSMFTFGQAYNLFDIERISNIGAKQFGSEYQREWLDYLKNVKRLSYTTQTKYLSKINEKSNYYSC